jgi:DNA-binding MarR family transcriptional regulator
MSEDWTDRLLEGWGDLQQDVDMSAYQVTARIARVGQHLARSQERVFARYGLNRGDVGVLGALRTAGVDQRLSPTELFKGLMLSSAGVTSRLDRLEKLGLVRRTRHPSDRRGVLVELTDDGRRVLDQAVRANTMVERELVGGLDAGDRAHLTDLLKRLLRTLESQAGDEP